MIDEHTLLKEVFAISANTAKSHNLSFYFNDWQPISQSTREQSFIPTSNSWMSLFRLEECVYTCFRVYDEYKDSMTDGCFQFCKHHEKDCWCLNIKFCYVDHKPLKNPESILLFSELNRQFEELEEKNNELCGKIKGRLEEL